MKSEQKTTPKIHSTHSETVHIDFLSNKTFIIGLPFIMLH